jgi:CRP/FNR family transcriptional regulator, cyclic AMP receptor protein
MVTADVVKSIPLFASLSERQLQDLTHNVIVRRFPRGTFIVNAGEKTDGLYLILSGRAKVLVSNKDGGEVIFANLGPGECFGEMGLLDDYPRSASVQALAACELLCLSKSDFMCCLSNNPSLGIGIIQMLVKRLRQANRQIESLALLDVYGRVARVLLDLSETLAGERVIQKAPTKQEIAHMVGASREMVSRVMRDLRNSGRIRIDKRRIVLIEKADNHSQRVSVQ